MKEPEGINERNAVITSAEIRNDDHGLLTAWLSLDYGGGGQGFGGQALYLPKCFKHHKLESLAGHFIWRVMEIADVCEWGKLKGRTIRVRQEQSRVWEIGHIVKDDWFCPARDFEEVMATAQALGVDLAALYGQRALLRGRKCHEPIR